MRGCRELPREYVARPHRPFPMPAFSTIATADLLAAATRLYTGARDTPAIADALDAYGYSATDFDAGLALVAALRGAMQTQGIEQAEKISASKAAALATAAVRVPYARHRTLARRAHPAGSAGYSALALQGSPSDDTTAMLAEARRFYETLAGQPGLTVRSLTPEAITGALAAVGRGRGGAGRADARVGRGRSGRRRCGSRRRRRCVEARRSSPRIALADVPQQRETLGLLERGS